MQRLVSVTCGKHSLLHVLQHIVNIALQEELALVEQQLNDQQQSSMKKMEKKGWEAADWKAKALEAGQELSAANAQVGLPCEPCGLGTECSIEWLVILFFKHDMP